MFVLVMGIQSQDLMLRLVLLADYTRSFWRTVQITGIVVAAVLVPNMDCLPRHASRNQAQDDHNGADHDGE